MFLMMIQTVLEKYSHRAKKKLVYSKFYKRIFSMMRSIYIEFNFDSFSK